MNRKKLQEVKKSLLLELKHHHDLEYDEELLLNDENDQLLNREDVGVLNVLISVHGSYIIASVGLFLLLDYFIDMLGSRKKVHNK